MMLALGAGLAFVVLLGVALYTFVPRQKLSPEMAALGSLALSSTSTSAPIVETSTPSQAIAQNNPTTTSPTQKTSTVIGIGAATPAASIATPPPAPTVTQQPAQPTLPPAVKIDAQTIVGILCYLHETYTNGTTGKSITDTQMVEVRGSGVIIGSQGYILTNRHVVQPADETTTINDSNGNPVSITIKYDLDHCEVGQMPKGTTLPTADEIRSLNPYVQIPVLGYAAKPVLVSPTAGRSTLEVQAADFAILKITGVTKNGPTFGVSSVPASFPYAKLLGVGDYNPVGDQVLTYGFPGDVTMGQENAFETLTMTGSVGTFKEIEVGDKYYADTPVIITSHMEIAHGRSGSPLFWRGYVIGVVTYYMNNNRTDSGSVASDAILKSLQGTGYYGS